MKRVLLILLVIIATVTLTGATLAAAKPTVYRSMSCSDPSLPMDPNWCWQ